MQFNFREEQAKNTRRTIVLVIAFMLTMAALGFAVGMAIGAGSVFASSETTDEYGRTIVVEEVDPWSPIPGLIGLGITTVIGVIMTINAWFGGGKMVLRSARARQITDKEKFESVQVQQLVNVTEEVALAAGLPNPALYIIEDEAMNAFATGRKPEEATVAVTRGLLEALNRDELQGVIAHEMGHVRNRDILYSVMIAVLVGAIILISDAFLRSMWYGGMRHRRTSSGSRDSSSSNAQALWIVIALLLALLAPALSMMMQFAISRKREYLADATAVEFTRNPSGLASALEKIAGCPNPLKSANRATAHLFIHQPIRKWEARAKSAFATHPPITERVKILKGMTYEAPPEEDA